MIAQNAIRMENKHIYIKQTGDELRGVYNYLAQLWAVHFDVAAAATPNTRCLAP